MASLYLLPPQQLPASSLFTRRDSIPALITVVSMKSQSSFATQYLSSHWPFTKLDLHRVYNLICIREANGEWNAFTTSRGHYEYLVMPFELANSLPVFQSFINDLFSVMLNHWLIVYIDDNFIHSNSMEVHVAYMKTVLQCLIDNHLYAKAKKCEFHLTSFVLKESP